MLRMKNLAPGIDREASASGCCINCLRWNGDAEVVALSPFVRVPNIVICQRRRAPVPFARLARLAVYVVRALTLPPVSFHNRREEVSRTRDSC